MPSITKSTGRLAWALSLLGLDRLAAFFSSASPWDQPEEGEVARTTSALDNLTHRVREMLSPTLQSMVDVGDRILDRFLGSLDALDKEQDLPWPFPAQHGGTSNPYPEDPPPADPYSGGSYPEDLHGGPSVSQAQPHTLGEPPGHGSALGHERMGQVGEWAPAPDLPDVGDFVAPRSASEEDKR